MFNLMRRASMLALVVGFVAAGAAQAAGIPRDGGATSDGFFRPSSPWIVDASAGLMIASGLTAPGLDVQFHKRLNTSQRMYLGAELGLFLNTSGTTYLMIPVLADFSMEFDASPTFHPTIGVSTGPMFQTAGSAAVFALMFNPGARIDIGSSSELDVKMRLGVISSSFVFIPQVGLAFAM